MNSASILPRSGLPFWKRARLRNSVLAGFLVAFWFSFTLLARAALQFDVFLGYDGLVPEGSWVPMVCEVKNDGPSFTATVEVKGGYNQDLGLYTTVELPTGTLKRFVIPVFSASFANWDVRLVDEKGRLRAEQPGLHPRKHLGRGAVLLGAIPRTPTGTPILKPIAAQNSDLQPASARLLPSIFPDNPLVLEGLDCLYLNSERAADLNIGQADALLGWLNGGGHLVVAVEQPNDVNSVSWLRNLLPCDIRDLKTIPRHPEFQDWLRSPTWPTVPTRAARPPNQQGFSENPEDGPSTSPFPNLPADFDFETKEMQIAVGQVRDGKVVLAAGETPLIVETHRGRGRLTVLLFSPEREPIRSWRELPTFWSKLAEVPASWYRTKDLYSIGGWSTDGVFGAMIDTRQVHKLPVGWLLAMLLVYLVVIGPLDQYWLKRIGKPMLTWITFPCYVVCFSLLIYFIGYKLRAGDSECNELHVVDVLRNGEKAELRGRTYSSIYSPANQHYPLASEQKFAVLRSEMMSWNNAAAAKASITQTPGGFKADVFVPVWTSELLVSDWWQSAALPLVAKVRATADGWEVHVENHTDQKLTNVQLGVNDRLFNVGTLAVGESRTESLTRTSGALLRNFVSNFGANFHNAVASRQRAIGSTSSGQIEDKANSAIALSFISQLGRSQAYQNSFSAPPGLEMSSVLEHGGAVLLAWAGGYAPTKPLEQFTPRRSQRDTLWRMPLNIE